MLGDDSAKTIFWRRDGCISSTEDLQELIARKDTRSTATQAHGKFGSVSASSHSRLADMRLRAVLNGGRRLLDVLRALERVSKTVTVLMSPEELAFVANPSTFDNLQVWAVFAAVRLHFLTVGASCRCVCT